MEAAANDLLYGIYAARWQKLAGGDIHQLTKGHQILDHARNRIGTWASCGSGEELKDLEKRWVSFFFFTARYPLGMTIQDLLGMIFWISDGTILRECGWFYVVPY